MIYRLTLERLTGGQYYARCEAVEKLRKEIRYQLEYCPCSGVSKDSIELDVRDLTEPWRRG